MAIQGIKRSHNNINENKVKRKSKRVKVQKVYHSSSEDESTFEGQEPEINITNNHSAKQNHETVSPDLQMEEPEISDTHTDGENAESSPPTSESEAEEEDSSSLSSNNDDDNGNEVNPRTSKLPKRNDPTAFATSMAKILDSKLTTSKRADPILARSQTAMAASKEITDNKLEAKVKSKIRVEKKEALEKGRVRDVLGLTDKSGSAEAVALEEKRLKKIAQRGVVKLFNAVRAAQVKGEEAAREAKKMGVVGMEQREGRVNEMSKKGFLDLIASEGRKGANEL